MRICSTKNDATKYSIGAVYTSCLEANVYIARLWLPRRRNRSADHPMNAPGGGTVVEHTINNGPLGRHGGFTRNVMGACS